MMKNLELTKKGKIILSVLGVLIIGLIIYLVIPKNNLTSLSIEMEMPNEGKLVDDPILGTTLELRINERIKLLETIYPEKSKSKTEYVSEHSEVAYVDEEGYIVGKSVGTTKIYLQTTNGKIRSNTIKITIVE